MRTVIFDLDGTLVDTSRDLIAAANATFRDLGMGDPLDHRTDAATAFQGARAMLRLGFSRHGGADEAIIDREYSNVLKHYGRDIDVFSRMYPGAVETVEALRHAGIRTGICTNKPHGLSEELLGRLRVRELFDSLIGADTLAVRKPDPAPYLRAVADAGGDPVQSVLIGDTITDRDTARAAGVPCVLVTFGPLGDGVRDLNPDEVLPDYAQFMDRVLPLIAG